MNTRFNAIPDGGPKIVYVLPVSVADLPDDIRMQVDGADKVYAVHRPDGARLALVANRQLAFALAREHDMVPVNAH